MGSSGMGLAQADIAPCSSPSASLPLQAAKTANEMRSSAYIPACRGAFVPRL